MIPLPVLAVLAGARRALAMVPREVWYALAIIAALLWLRSWHNGTVNNAREDGRAAGAQAQGEADARAYTEAAIAAADAQQAIIITLTGKQTAINERTADALDARTSDLRRRYDDLRLRWAAATKANPGGTSQSAAAAVPGGAAPIDLTSCAAQGWVSFDVAAAAALAADMAIAKDDQWIAWYQAQLAAWPQ